MPTTLGFAQGGGGANNRFCRWLTQTMITGVAEVVGQPPPPSRGEPAATGGSETRSGLALWLR
eukprot:4710982-Alexandrium_andersonii.AAC.1